MRFIFFFLFLTIVFFTSKQNTAHANKIDSLEQLLKKSSGTERIKLLNELCYRYHESDIVKSVSYGKEALALVEKTDDDRLKANVLLNLGISEEYHGNHDAAMKKFIKALKLFEQFGEQKSIARTLNSIGTIYFYQKNYEKTVEFWERAIKIKYELNDQRDLANGMNNLAVAYARMERYDEALDLYEKAIVIYEQLGAQKNRAYAMNNVGILLHKKNNDPAAALPYYQAAMQVYDSIGNRLAWIESVMNSGTALYDMKRYEEAKEMFEKSYEAALGAGAAMHLHQSYAGLSEVNEALNNPAEALKYYKLAVAITDSIRNENVSNQILELEKKYETEKKEQQIAMQQLEISKSKYKLYVLASASALLLMLAFSFSWFFYQRKKAKEIIEQTKSNFFSNIVHEFRTPVTLITAPIERVMERTSDAETKSTLQLAQRNAAQLLKLVNQLLDVSKIESGKMVVNKTAFNINDLLYQIMEVFEATAKEKNIALQFDNRLQQNWLKADADIIEKILANLLSNAFKFTDGGQIRVVAEEKNSELTIQVSDTGKGIAAKDLPHIFDRFYKSESADNKQGTGIGLALVKELAELHGGFVFAESRVGAGTVITVQLPVETATPLAATINDASENHEFAADKKLILIAEDNTDMSVFIQSILQQEGFETICAADGNTALKLALENVPDFIITDVMMPEMDGLQLTQKLKENIATNHIPIIMLTAKASPESRVEGLEHGTDIYLSKPFHAKELLLNIRNLILLREKLQERFSIPSETKETALNEPVSILKTEDVFLKKLIQKINEQLSNEHFGVEELSSAIYLSRTQMHRKVKALTGHSVSRFIRMVRLEKARELLLVHAGNVTEVAYQTGFSSQSYFSKCFAEHFGYSPKEVG